MPPVVGWYRHPDRPLEHRYWDGRAWVDWTDWVKQVGSSPVPAQRDDPPGRRRPGQTS